MFLNSFFPLTLIEWNQLDTDIRNSPSYISHSPKGVRIRSYSGPYFSAFGLNRERYFVSLRIQSECGKILTRITLNTDTFYAVSQ